MARKRQKFIPFFLFNKNFAYVNGKKKSAIYDFRKKYVTEVPQKLNILVDHDEIITEEHSLKYDSPQKRKIKIAQNDGKSETIISRVIAKKRGLERGTSDLRLDFLWLEITNACNLHCAHCYASSGKENSISELGLKKVNTIIDSAMGLGCQSVQFTGGEPLLRMELKMMIDYAKKAGIKYIEVFTNATLVDGKFADWAKKAAISIAVSAYSDDRSVHDSITGMAGSFERTINGIKLLVERDVPIRCEIIAMARNASIINNTEKFFSKLGIKAIDIHPTFPSGRAKYLDNDIILKHGEKFGYIFPCTYTDKNGFVKNTKWNSCWYGKLAILSTGEVCPCIFAREQVIGNVNNKTLKQLIRSQKLMGYWQLNMDKIKVCKECEYRYACTDCRPLVYGITRDMHQKTPLCKYDPRR